MSSAERPRSAVLLIVGTVVLLAARGMEHGVLVPDLSNPTTAQLGLTLVGMVFLVLGCNRHARGKGYSGWLGALGVLGLLGVFVLVAIPSKYGIPDP